MEMDDEILEDFLIEAGEIIEQLGEQLVQLEQRPDDTELLNAVFRAFHTVKGGAGFLALNDLVEICHEAENVFNLLRSGERVIDATLMDCILKAFDVVTVMFQEIRSGMPTTPADAELLGLLGKYGVPGEVEFDAAPVAAESESKVDSGDVDDSPMAAQDGAEDLFAEDSFADTDDDESAESDLITEDEFDSLLDLLHGKKEDAEKPSAEPAAEQDDALITDDEFEALLDSLSDAKSGSEGAAPVAPKPEPAAEEATLKVGESVAADPIVEEKPKPAVAPFPPTPKPTQSKSAKVAANPEPLKSQAVETNIRVETKVLDDIMNMVGELVLVRNRLLNLVASSGDDDVTQAVINLNLVTSQLQVSAMKTRMQPIKKVFGRFPRVVRDVSRSLDKDIKLSMHGEETDLDKNLVEALADPLVHLVRNSVDHGIEIPAERIAAGKPPQGEIVLSADQEGDSIVLKIKDDGKGMDPEILRQSVVNKGLMDRETVDRLSDAETFALIFMPGFSTKAEVSDISGRGVGMDVVKTRINELSGSVEIQSELNVGTEITIRVPLTLAIVAALVVGVNEQLYALPLAIVNEIFDLNVASTKMVDGQLVVVSKDEVLPIFQLGKWMAPYSVTELKDNSHVVVVSVGVRRVGFVVDKLYGQEEVVIKPLGTALDNVKGFAGATINGDGRMALILDAPGLIEKYA